MGFQETFKALSDPVRREILVMLKDGRKSAGEIGERFEMTGVTISYHLSILKKADLVSESKYKNFIYYELNASAFVQCFLDLQCGTNFRNRYRSTLIFMETQAVGAKNGCCPFPSKKKK